MRNMISYKEFFDELTVRAKRVLDRLGCKTISDVGQTTFDILSGSPNCGDTTQREIVNGLAVAYGVSFEWAWPRVCSHIDLPMAESILAQSSTTQDPVQPPFGYQKCGTCRWWEQWKDEEFSEIGCCVRHAPIPVIDPSDDTSDPSATWPTTNKNSRCGEWKFNG